MTRAPSSPLPSSVCRRAANSGRRSGVTPADPRVGVLAALGRRARNNYRAGDSYRHVTFVGTQRISRADS